MVDLSGSIKLRADDDVALEIASDIKGWATVLLCTEDCKRPLGSERLTYILTKLLAFIKKEHSSEIEWVLSLSELHNSVYGVWVDDVVRLKIRDQNAKWIAEMSLSPERLLEWGKALDSLSTVHKS